MRKAVFVIVALAIAIAPVLFVIGVLEILKINP